MSSSQQFDVDLEWRAGSSVPAPQSLGETEGGTSSGKLLVAAIASSFGSALAEMLRATGLPYSLLDVHAEGLLASDVVRRDIHDDHGKPDHARRGRFAASSL